MTEHQRIICDKWKSHLAKHVAEHDLNNIVMPYIKAVVEKDLPVILGLNHLSSMMQLGADTLKRMIVSSHSFYHSFTMPKRKGGTRQIDAPYPSMMRAQQWIYHEVLSKVTISPSATGFIPHHSIKDNASPHLNQRCLLLLDVKDFFPSIKWHKVYAVFSHLGYPKIISQYLASLCCLNGHAPQGAVTSPTLSNVITRRLDARITGLAKKYQVIYTRYADDMTFSGESISKRFQSFIYKIVEDDGFIINQEKTRYIKGKHQKIVTGISISEDKLTVPKSKRREVRQQVYYIKKYGLADHQKKIGNNDPIYLERLIGYLHFWHSIEPENKFVNNSLVFLLSVRDKNRNTDIGVAPVVPELKFDEYQLLLD